MGELNINSSGNNNQQNENNTSRCDRGQVRVQGGWERGDRGHVTSGSNILFV